jgi:farnesyl-diphosphate farnesyltransferase
MALETLDTSRVAPTGVSDRLFCAEILPRVSRTFAICIRLLPSDLSHPVSVAYLLCRIADSIEDSPTLSGERKRDLLDQFSRSLTLGGPGTTPLHATFADPSSDDEFLAREADIVLREFRRLPGEQQDAIRPWVQEMSAGMAEYAERRSDSSQEHIEALTTVEELDRYCYYVAGTVGHLLTELFCLHAGCRDQEQYGKLESLATSFGLGLQLTNIIKDVADDRRRGWVFVPQELCQLAGITPEQLHDERYRDGAQRVMTLLIDKAKVHLLDALEYTTVIPRRQYGIRLFCLSALYFAVRTLRLAASDDRLLDPQHKVKISRGQVYRTLAMTRLVAPSNTLVRQYFRSLAGSEWDSELLAGEKSR